MVLEEHRDVARPVVVDPSQPRAQEVRETDALVAVAAVRPGAVVLAQEHAAGDVGMRGARFDLRAEGEGSVECRGGHRNLLDRSGWGPLL